MRVLESVPCRYEVGIRLLTFGHLDVAYDRLASHIDRGQQVLDIGCGTGALTLRAARCGAKVKGIDINAQMLDIAEQRVKNAGLTESVELVERGVAELDSEETHRYDAVMSGLCLSELSDDELRYTLKQMGRVLRPGGLVLIADEIKPQGVINRVIHHLIRIPLAAFAYIITQQTTRPATDLPEKLKAAGFAILSIHLNRLKSFGEFVAQNPVGIAP